MQQVLIKVMTNPMVLRSIETVLVGTIVKLCSSISTNMTDDDAKTVAMSIIEKERRK
jgi:hypothetical protein